MGKFQISLMSALLLAGGLPIWLALCLMLPSSTGWGDGPTRFVITPLLLTGITIALHRLFPKHRDGWAIAILLAGMIAWSVVWGAFWISQHY